MAKITISPTLSGLENLVPLQQMSQPNFYFSVCSFFFLGGGGGKAGKGNFYMYKYSSNQPSFSYFLQIPFPDFLLNFLPLSLLLLN